MSRIYCDPDCLRYHTPGHPESPERVERTARRLRAAGHALLQPFRQATADDVGLAHAAGHFEAVRDGHYCEPDTPHYDGIDIFALKSVSAAVSAAFSAIGGEPAFSLMRPPGHHAGKRRAAGFCYFNNLAIACAALWSRDPSLRIGILDFDAHHGDGTQDILQGRPGVLYVSLHQAPLYPGTGLESKDNCLNLPLPPGTGEDAYLRSLDKGLDALRHFGPGLLAVSAGFDAYGADPIAQLRLEKTSFRRIGALLAKTGLRRFAVLEGGYAPDLPVLVENFLEAFL
ncbi:MAG: histone deacetylase [Elusimicrobia bacterium]|nr:histone deacetylase [Elusimicrobiota bacterium]